MFNHSYTNKAWWKNNTNLQESIFNYLNSERWLTSWSQQGAQLLFEPLTSAKLWELENPMLKNDRMTPWPTLEITSTIYSESHLPYASDQTSPRLLFSVYWTKEIQHQKSNNHKINCIKYAHPISHMLNCKSSPFVCYVIP